MSIKITNLHNLPIALVNAAKLNMPRIAGDLSVSALIDAPQIRMLKRTHEVEVDVMDRIPGMLGTALHILLERSNIKDFNRRALLDAIDILHKANKDQDPQMAKAIAWLEKKTDELFPKTAQDYLYGFTLHSVIEETSVYGTVDSYDVKGHILDDYKRCSVYDFMIPESKKKWEAEINCFAHLLRLNGFPVVKANVIAFFNDWSRAKAGFEKDYPPHPCMNIEIHLESPEVMSKYISARVKLHRQAEQGDIAPCSGKDKWAKATKYAAMVPGGKRAINATFINEAEAHRFKEKNASKYPNLFIETRLGENVRCLKYCSVREVCPQRKREMQNTQPK